MLLGIGYSQDCDPDVYNCDCNEDTWQEYYNSEGHNMEGCYLYGAWLQGADLYQANLSGANLSGANLMWTWLPGANLTGANLKGANLKGTWLQAGGLPWDMASWANLSGANLCNLTGSPSLDVCEESVTDSNGDGYDDVSYDAGANSADPCYGVVCDDDPEMICICGECTYEDEQGDTGGAEDCSYGDECFETGAESGDLNLDGADNVQDVVILVNNILNP